MQIYFHSHLCSYLSRVPILVEGTVIIINAPAPVAHKTIYAKYAAQTVKIKLKWSRILYSFHLETSK